MLCKSGSLTSQKVSDAEPDGYYDVHHTCNKCGAHFDHLSGVVFESCDICGYKN